MKTLKKLRTAARKPRAVRTTSNLDLPCPKMGALELIGRLPDDVTWDQLLYHLEVRKGIEHSMAQADAGLLQDHDEFFDELLSELEEEAE